MYILELSGGQGRERWREDGAAQLQSHEAGEEDGPRRKIVERCLGEATDALRDTAMMCSINSPPCLQPNSAARTFSTTRALYLPFMAGVRASRVQPDDKRKWLEITTCRLRKIRQMSGRATGVREEEATACFQSFHALENEVIRDNLE